MSMVLQVTRKGRRMTTHEVATMVRRTAETTGQTEDDCLRWLWRELYAPDGVSAVCPKCRAPRKFHRVSGRRAFSCAHCGRQVYPTVGTIFERSNLSLPTWFQAVRLILTSGEPPSARRLETELAVSYAAALRIRRKVSTAVQAGGGPATLLTKIAQGSETLTVESDSLATRAGARPVSPVKEAILAGACRAFAERGLASTRIVDIATEAGVSSAIIHYYFKGKDQVLLAALRWASEQHEMAVAQITAETSDHVERLRRYLDIIVPGKGTLRDEYILWLEVWLATRKHPDFVDECVAMSRRTHGFVEKLIEDGTRVGAFAPVASCETIAWRIIAIRDGLCCRCVVGYRDMDRSIAHRILCEFVAQSLGLPASELGVLGEGTCDL